MKTDTTKIFFHSRGHFIVVPYHKKNMMYANTEYFFFHVVHAQLQNDEHQFPSFSDRLNTFTSFLFYFFKPQKKFHFFPFFIFSSSSLGYCKTNTVATFFFSISFFFSFLFFLCRKRNFLFIYLIK